MRFISEVVKVVVVLTLSNGPPPSPASTVAEVLRQIKYQTAGLGHGMRVSILVAWMGALLLGISTLMVRLLLYHINREAGDSTS